MERVRQINVESDSLNNRVRSADIVEQVARPAMPAVVPADRCRPSAGLPTLPAWRRAPHGRVLLLLLALLATTALARAQVDPNVVKLSDAMAAWRNDIEQLNGGELVLVRYFPDRDGIGARVELPRQPDHSGVLMSYLRTPGFREALENTYALSLNYRGPEGVLHFVVLNMTHADEWLHFEESVLAHEFGHIWLSARGYAAPVFDGGESSCVAMVSGDAVQHILIRKELHQRGIPYLAYWISKLEATREALAAGPVGHLPDCRLLTLMGEWLDVRLGLSPAVWQGYERYESQMEHSFPMLAEDVERLVGLLEGQDVEDRATYQALLGEASGRVSQVFNRLRKTSVEDAGSPR